MGNTGAAIKHPHFRSTFPPTYRFLSIIFRVILVAADLDLIVNMFAIWGVRRYSVSQPDFVGIVSIL